MFLSEMEVTQDEATSFLHDVLQMKDAPPPPSATGGEKLHYLNTLIESIFDKVPCQSLSFLAIPEEERDLPSVAAVKKSMLARWGTVLGDELFYVWAS